MTRSSIETASLVPNSTTPIFENPSWTIENSASLYRIDSWGSPFFQITDKGDVAAVISESDDGPETRLSLHEVVKELRTREIPLPAIVRFPNILSKRISSLIGAFEGAIATNGYRGRFRGCFPIKVNQKREVIHEIASLSRSNHFGFEAGTKAELLIAVSHLSDPEAFIICNGYKDRDFVDLALYATKAGLKVVLVIERTDELETILERSRALNATPVLGVRVRITSGGSGRWASTSGGQGLFGLTALELVRTIDRLKLEDRLDCLKMLHFHQGSQIPDLGTIRRGIDEAASIFAQLCAEGAPLSVINIGGGLAIDYEGTGVVSQSSKNYSVEEYCQGVVATIRKRMDASGIPHPDIISESGRAIASHYSVLVFDVFGGASSQKSKTYEPKPDDPKSLHRLYQLFDSANAKNAVAQSRLADDILEGCHESFQSGEITLRHLAAAQRLRSCLADRIREQTSGSAPRSQTLRNHLSEHYYANFSVFQSMPDAWAIGQLFPVMPIHRLDEQPTHSAVIADITCDCDGKIKRYIGAHDESETIPVHSLRSGEPYYMAVFLVGAYQETLGDIHNLLGDPSVVSVRAHRGEMVFDRAESGDTIEDILRQVDYPRSLLQEGFGRMLDAGISSSEVTGEERNAMVRLFDEILDSTTYLIRSSTPPVS
ncbi:MAG: biosynthetic arginine decarboxylase [Verrucomicrobiae bacterium]|nr:biosynthetic arginine decarboxylase [Verrucomicrobiae bacterium]